MALQVIPLHFDLYIIALHQFSCFGRFLDFNSLILVDNVKITLYIVTTVIIIESAYGNYLAIRLVSGHLARNIVLSTRANEVYDCKICMVGSALLYLFHDFQYYLLK